MGNINDGEQPLKEKKTSSGTDKSEPGGTASLNDEAGRLLAEKNQRIHDSAMRTEYPALNAMAARSVYYGMQGRLLPSMDQIRGVMSESGPIGEAAVTRMQALAGKGWTFGALSPGDQFILNQSSTTMGRLGKSIMLGGYNDARSGKIAYNAVGSMMNAVTGISDGADKDAANKYIHELAHGKYAAGYQQYEASPAAIEALRKLAPEAQIVHGQQMVQEELRAVTAQVAANIQQQGEFRAFLSPQTRGLSNYPLEAALKNDKLGALVKDVWPYEGSKALSTEQADAAAANYMKSNYGDLFKDGKLNPQAEKAIAAEISRLPVEAPTGEILRASAVTAETAFSSPRYFEYLSRGGQALGSLAVLAAVSDLNNQFRISTGSGVGRLLSVGSDWAGFEGGACVGGWIGEGVTAVLVKTNPRLAMVALPLFTMGSGLVSSQIMHGAISKPLEIKTQKGIDELLAKDH